MMKCRLASDTMCFDRYYKGQLQWGCLREWSPLIALEVSSVAYFYAA